MNRRIAVVGDSLSSGGTIQPYSGPPFLVHGHQAELIDLWNGSRMTVSSVPGVISTFGRAFGMHELLPDTDFGWSDLRNSKQILFWEIR
ncbi:hypothetical protein [Burkholderia lata]|uniref:hypothetical protein n=1 Tax=Burkholderia lata (strain ATCC 17760 / DSM 23089 / LMG 22485 / NCIMB 9086 / R18194 / 383) TaxID=482957 RepID=UPI0020C70B78|nr:hypothetical protein [Burkholderia lata]